MWFPLLEKNKSRTKITQLKPPPPSVVSTKEKQGNPQQNNNRVTPYHGPVNSLTDASASLSSTAQNLSAWLGRSVYTWWGLYYLCNEGKN